MIDLAENCSISEKKLYMSVALFVVVWKDSIFENSQVEPQKFKVLFGQRCRVAKVFRNSQFKILMELMNLMKKILVS